MQHLRILHNQPFNHELLEAVLAQWSNANQSGRLNETMLCHGKWILSSVAAKNRGTNHCERYGYRYERECPGSFPHEGLVQVVQSGIARLVYSPLHVLKSLTKSPVVL